jgi:hypothetical protein
VLTVHGDNRPSLQAWMEARVRLAQLMKREHFNAVAEYYSILQTDERLGPRGNLIGQASMSFASPTQTWAERTEAVKDILKRYAEPSGRKTLIGV